MIRNKYRVKVLPAGDIHRSLNNKLHSTTGPAIEWINGYKEWLVHGKWLKYVNDIK